MSWGRISHPSEMVKIDDEIEVMILHIDREKEKIALGLKQKTASPWDNVDKQVPGRHADQGEVVNVMCYGAFVKLEDGIEGLVHISEMSWTKRVNHPSELVTIGDEVEVVVLGINKDKQEISLGMKQTQPNPWDEVAAKYPPGADGQRDGSQPHQLRCLHRTRRRHRRPAARQRHVVDPQDFARQRNAQEGRPDHLPGDLGRPGTQTYRARPEATGRRSVGNHIPRTLPAGHDRSSARSPRSPTSVSSSNSKTSWKACCTFRNCPTTRSKTRKKSSRSAILEVKILRVDTAIARSA